MGQMFQKYLLARVICKGISILLVLAIFSITILLTPLSVGFGFLLDLLFSLSSCSVGNIDMLGLDESKVL